MTLWTIQTLPKWEQFQKTKLLRAEHEWIHPPFLDYYDWIEDEMKFLVGSPPKDVVHPIWAWYRSSKRTRSPDLRARGHLRRGEDGVRIRFKVDPKDVLLTDFSDWHSCLNTDDPKDIRNRQTRLENIDDHMDASEVKWPWHIEGDELVMQWKKIIVQPDSKLHHIQACVWQVHMDDVEEIKFFKSK